MKLSDKIRIIRKARHLSQEELGYSLSRVSKEGISRQSVSDWENGNTEPKLENIRDLAETLNVSYDALLDESVDLSNEETLSDVLNHKQKGKDGKVQSSVSYSFYQRQINKGKVKRIIIYWSIIVACLVPLFIFLVTGANNSTLLIIQFIFDVIVFALLPTAIVSSVGSKYHYVLLGSFHDSIMTIRATGSGDNVIYVPIDKIESVERVNPTNKTKVDNISIRIVNRVKPIVLLDVSKPDEVVAFYSNLVDFIENPDEIKIL